MDKPDAVKTFFWLLQMTTEVAPAYLALLILPIVAFRFQGGAAAIRATIAVILAHVGPLLMLLMGASLFGQGRSHAWLSVVQTAVAVAGVWLVVRFTKRLRSDMPRWVFVLFFVGVGIITVFAWFIGGMALVDDWV